MSWDAYLDNLVARSKDSQGSEHIDRACIVGLQDGGSLWTSAGHPKGIKVLYIKYYKFISFLCVGKWT